MTQSPILRLILCLTCTAALSACSSTSDRYAFWRNDDSHSTAPAPRLSDVPAAPKVETAKAEMESLRQRLEIERQNTFRAAQGLDPLPLPPAMKDEMAPGNDVVILQPMKPQAPVTTQMAQLGGVAVPTMPYQNGAVQFNTANTAQQDTYVYGNSVVQMKQTQQPVAEASQIMNNNPSIQIDMSALDNRASYTTTPAVARTAPVFSSMPLSQGQTIASFAHGSATLNAKDKSAIATVAAQVQQQQKSVVLVGHASKRTGIADPITSQIINLRMAAKRAETVMKELSQQGVPPQKIKITALGDSQDQGQETLGRRVDILFDK